MATFKALPEALRAPITALEDAKAFISALIEAELMWHLEEDAVDCLHETNPLISREDAAFLNSQRDALYTHEWGEFDCPIGYALHCLDL